MKRFFYFLCVTFIPFIFSEETIYPRFLDSPRVKLDPNDRILLYTPSRTGSTFVYNVLNYLCEDILWIPNQFEDKRVQKTHYPDKNGVLQRLLSEGRNVILIVTVRNPIDSTLSLCNILDVSYKNGAIHYAKYIAKEFVGIKKSIVPSTILRYEHFNNNFPYLFNKIEELLKVEIPDNVKKEVSTIFSREAMKSIADALGSFDKVDPLTQLHGNHVDKELSEYVASPIVREAILPYLKEAMKLWQY